MSITIERVRKARMLLLMPDKGRAATHGMFASLALRLRLVEAPWCQTAAVDGTHLFLAPKFIASLDDQQLQGLIAHEALHCMLGHPWRRDKRDRRLWNIANDYAINPMCLAAGMKLPPGGLADEKYKGMSSEQIYALLQQNQQQQKKPGEGGNGEKGEKGEGGGQAGDGQPGEGSGQPGEDDPRAPGYEPTFGEVIDAPEETAAQTEVEWRIAAADAVRQAKMRGDLPGDLERLIGLAVAPRVDWKAVLRRFVQQCAAADYTWSAPSVRHAVSGLYLPKLRSENMPAIVVGIDTSGSIGGPELNAFTSEVSSIIDEVRPEETHVVFCDSRVGRTQTFVPGDPLEFKPTGGGGTDMPKIFEWVQENDIAPACVIILTDMYTPFGEEQEYPVLWAASTKGIEAPHGETVYIGE